MPDEIPILAEIVPPGTTAAAAGHPDAIKAAADEGSRVAQAGELAASETALGQRRINIIWERTQFIIAISVVEAALLVAVVIATGLVTGPPENRQVSIVALYGLANLVIGFYFGRTNHSRTGGIGGMGVGYDR